MAAEDAATEAQIKHLYGVIHGLGMDPKEWKKNSNIASFAKLTRKQCSDYITELEEMEAEQKRARQLDEAEKLQQNSKGAGWKIERGEQRFGDRADAEAQRIREEQGLATTPAAEAAQPATPPTVEELIFKYIDILAKVTVAVEQEDRIPEKEKGYGIKFVYYSVKGAIENGRDHEEQA